ncbi:MAG TPA: aldo/keto reductase, partial [Spirochaetota bacterium]
MKMITLGRTGLRVPQLSFGALPIQRTEMTDAVKILRKAYDNGIRFFDTARMYSDSEVKLGAALSGVRKEIIIATKTMAVDAKTAREQLETSLANLRTDYIDIMQLHNPDKCPDPSDKDSAYAALIKAKEEGLVRYIGMTNHRASVAREAVSSGMFDTLQFPLSHISSDEDLAIIELCRSHNVGVIAMKALCGGLITNIPAAFAFFRQYDNVAPIWGIQHEEELDEFLALEKNPPALTDDLRSAIEADRKDLASTFCRGCGYCLPC